MSRAQAARQAGMTALLHHVNVDLLRFAFHQLKRRAAPGVDGITWHEYEADLEANLADLHGRVQRGAHRAKPSRRQYIPKPDGGQRPLGIAALEDKIVQRAVMEVLNAIYGTSSASPTASARGAASTMRWTRSWSGSTGGGSTGSWMPISGRSSTA